MTHDHGKDVELANFSERVVAFAVDILLFVALFPVTLSLLFPGEPLWNHSKGYPMVWIFIGIFLVYQAFMASEGRVSLGKRLMGLKVVDMHGHALSVPAAMLRSVGYMLSSMFSLGFIWGLFSGSRQGWHDLLVGSVVVSSRRKTASFHKLALAGSWAVVAAIAAIYTWEVAWANAYYRVSIVADAQVGLDEIGRLQHIHKSLYGRYAESLESLAPLSGQPYTFLNDMHHLFDAEKGVTMKVTRNGYELEARAIDRRHTTVRLSGA
jgi:uncharacterized RDD family membrane protein YckC